MDELSEEVLPALDYVPFVALHSQNVGSSVLNAEDDAAEDETHEVSVSAGWAKLTLWIASKRIEYEDRDALLIVATDVTEARRLEERCARRRRWRRSALAVRPTSTTCSRPSSATPNSCWAGPRRAAAKQRYLGQIRRAANAPPNSCVRSLPLAGRQAAVGADVCACVDEVLDLLRPTPPSTIELLRQCDLPDAYVLADSHEIVQVIMNLCTNAYQAIGEAPGRIIVRASGCRGRSRRQSRHRQRRPRVGAPDRTGQRGRHRSGGP